MPADRVLTKNEVADVDVIIDGLANEHAISWGDRRRLDALAVSHEVLRAANRTYQYRVQAAWEAQWRAEEAAEELAARLEAMTNVARRHLAGCHVMSFTDGHKEWWHPTEADDGPHAALTDAEAAALDALEADDAG